MSLPGRDSSPVTFDRIVEEYRRVYRVVGMEPTIEDLGDLKAASDIALLSSREKIRYSEYGRQILYPLPKDWAGIRSFTILEARMGGMLLRTDSNNRSLLMVLPDRGDPKRVPTRGKTHGLANGSLELYDQDVVPTYARDDQHAYSGPVYSGPLVFSGTNRGETYVWFGMQSFHVPSGVIGSLAFRYNCWVQSSHTVGVNEAFFDYVYNQAALRE